MENKRVIEINGIKIEVDLSTARRIDEFKIGDNVKVLMKEYDSYKVYPGVIVEFVNFKELPTIIIAMFKQSYSESTVTFINFNSETENIEITLCADHEMKLEKCRVIDKFNLEIEKKMSELDELISKRDWFIKYFNRYFENNLDQVKK
jgi:hypothetical protein